MATLTLPIAASLGALKPQEDLPVTFPKGRRCVLPSCITVLCQFNPGPRCYCHTRRDPREEA